MINNNSLHQNVLIYYHLHRLFTHIVSFLISEPSGVPLNIFYSTSAAINNLNSNIRIPLFQSAELDDNRDGTLYMDIFVHTYRHLRPYIINLWTLTSSSSSSLTLTPLSTGIVGLFCYDISLYYLYVDSLTYAFSWSAFLCRIRFCDTLVVIFLSKHHHHEQVSQTE
jgi:hypothetical protein